MTEKQPNSSAKGFAVNLDVALPFVAVTTDSHRYQGGRHHIFARWRRPRNQCCRQTPWV